MAKQGLNSCLPSLFMGHLVLKDLKGRASSALDNKNYYQFGCVIDAFVQRLSGGVGCTLEEGSRIHHGESSYQETILGLLARIMSAHDSVALGIMLGNQQLNAILFSKDSDSKRYCGEQFGEKDTLWRINLHLKHLMPTYGAVDKDIVKVLEQYVPDPSALLLQVIKAGLYPSWPSFFEYLERRGLNGTWFQKEKEWNELPTIEVPYSFTNSFGDTSIRRILSRTHYGPSVDTKKIQEMYVGFFEKTDLSKVYMNWLAQRIGEGDPVCIVVGENCGGSHYDPMGGIIVLDIKAEENYYLSIPHGAILIHEIGHWYFDEKFGDAEHLVFLSGLHQRRGGQDSLQRQAMEVMENIVEVVMQPSSEEVLVHGVSKLFPEFAKYGALSWQDTQCALASKRPYEHLAKLLKIEGVECGVSSDMLEMERELSGHSLCEERLLNDPVFASFLLTPLISRYDNVTSFLNQTESHGTQSESPDALLLSTVIGAYGDYVSQRQEGLFAGNENSGTIPEKAIEYARNVVESFNLTKSEKHYVMRVGDALRTGKNQELLVRYVEFLFSGIIEEKELAPMRYMMEKCHYANISDLIPLDMGKLVDRLVQAYNLTEAQKNIVANISGLHVPEKLPDLQDAMYLLQLQDNGGTHNAAKVIGEGYSVQEEKTLDLQQEEVASGSSSDL